MQSIQNRRFVWIALAVILSLVLPWAAFADNVQNDVTVGGNDTFALGNSTTVNYRITANNGDGQAGCNASDGSAATVIIHVPSGVYAAPESLIFTSCGSGQPVKFTADAAGDYAITVSVSDNGTGSYNTNPAKFTLHVLAPSDDTAPFISYNITGTAGKNGWYTSDVFVDWTVTDPESLFTTTGCVDTTINYETTGVTLSCSASSAGGSADPVAVTIKVDKTGPTAVLAVTSGTLGNEDWYISDVTVSTSGTDDISSPVVCTAGQYLTFDTTSTDFNGSCTNDAGLATNATPLTVKRDATPPTITWNSGPAAGGTYYFGFVPPAATCTAIDDISGPAGCTVTGYSTAVGTHTMTATAYDVAGNSYSEQRSYTVSEWTLSGFYQPVDMNGVWNTVKGGSTVPLKFEVFAGSTELTNVSYISGFTVTGVTCPGANAPTDEVEFTTTGGTSLRYDSTAGQFIQNWQTPKIPGACYRVTMTTLDGAYLAANFKLK